MRPTSRASSAATASQVSTGALACAAFNAGCFAAKDKKCATRASLARRAELLRWAMASDPSRSCEAPGVPEPDRFDQREMAGVSFRPLLGSYLWIVKTISGRGQC